MSHPGGGASGGAAGVAPLGARGSGEAMTATEPVPMGRCRLEVGLGGPEAAGDGGERRFFCAAMA